MSRKVWLVGVGLACAACCSLPLLLVGAGGLAALGTDVWGCGSLLILVGAVWYWYLRRQSNLSCANTRKQHCEDDCGCKVP